MYGYSNGGWGYVSGSGTFSGYGYGQGCYSNFGYQSGSNAWR